jgi:hypothetical protein
MQSDNIGEERTETTAARTRTVTLPMPIEMDARPDSLSTPPPQSESDPLPSLPPPHPASILFNRRRVSENAGVYRVVRDQLLVREEPDAA